MRQFCRLYFQALPDKSTLLIAVTTAAIKQAQKVKVLLENLNSLSAHQLLKTWETFRPRIEQVVEPTSRRIFKQEKVSAAEKIVSIFEVHTAIICRGKINLDVEFGRKVWLDEVDGGLVSNYRVLDGNPHDTQQLVASLDQHLENFGGAPKLVSADRGVYSQSNEKYAEDLGIKQVILPKGGYRSQSRIQQERKRNFVKGRHWHNGVEGRISFLKRCERLSTLSVSRRCGIQTLGGLGHNCSQFNHYQSSFSLAAPEAKLN